MKTAAILQSSYLPWKGYFDIIHDVDTFIFFDDVQYTERDWRNRNKIKGPNGVFWLTIPVPKNSVQLRIDQVSILDSEWQKKHWLSLHRCYSRARYFWDYIDFFEEVYTTHEWQNLSELNRHLIYKISGLLGINVEFVFSSEYSVQGEKTDRLLNLLKLVKADRYVSGPSAKAYIEENKFADAGIELVYKNYHYPAYPQLWGEFVHQVSIVDMLFNLGQKTPEFIWGKEANAIDDSRNIPYEGLAQ